MSRFCTMLLALTLFAATPLFAGDMTYNQRANAMGALLADDMAGGLDAFAASMGKTINKNTVAVSDTNSALSGIAALGDVSDITRDDFRNGADCAVIYFSPKSTIQSDLDEGYYTLRFYDESKTGTPVIEFVDANGKVALAAEGMLDVMSDGPEPTQAAISVDISVSLHASVHFRGFGIRAWAGGWVKIGIHIGIGQDYMPEEDGRDKPIQ